VTDETNPPRWDLVRALLCLIGLHDWRYAGSGESVCGH
jgi:hypothetical protein